jgi:hypothetical protein
VDAGVRKKIRLTVYGTEGYVRVDIHPFKWRYPVRIRSAFLLALGVAVAACSDNPTEPTGVSGSLSFSYTGAGTTSATTYSASGSIPTNINSSLGSNAWAVGSVDPNSNYVVVGAVIPRTSTTWDITSVGIGRKTVGTSDIDPNCDIESPDCTGIFVLFGQGQTDSNFSFGCSLTTGTVTITSISSSNITGTFSGSGDCFAPNGAFSDFTVTNGTFNVGISTQLLD